MQKNDPQRPPTEQELEDLNANWDDDGKQFDPHRGDRVDVLNDTTPAPAPQRHDFPPSERHKKKHRWPLLLAIIVVIAAAAYFVIEHPKTASTPNSTTPAVVGTPSKTPAAATTTKHYDSQNFTLGLDYPDTWKLTDAATMLTIVSPAQSLTAATGKQVSGHVIVTIQPKQTSVPNFKAGAATAVIASQKITYKNPTANQRAQTYVSLLGYAGDTSSGLDGIYITGDNGYTLNQTVPQADVVQTDPLVTVTFAVCTTADCAANPTPLSLRSADWKDGSLNGPILTILQSLALN